MNKFTVLFIGVLLSLVASADEASHQCQVIKTTQFYNAQSMKFEGFTRAQSLWFPVTSKPHEDSYTIPLSNELGSSDETVSVWTGTVLSQPDGDLIQANATFVIQGQTENAALAMSVKSPFTFTTRDLDYESNGKFCMVAVDLKCVSK
ncbi:hypothetical protein WDW86_14765 [Bdellovibrionota bacterium FG-2]